MAALHILAVFLLQSRNLAATCVERECRSGDKTIAMLQRSVKASKIDILDEGETEQQQVVLQQLQEQAKRRSRRQREHEAGSITLSGKKVYNFDRRFYRSKTRRQGEGITHWLVWFDEDVEDALIHEACEQILEDTGYKCVHEGHPSGNGIAYLDFEGTDEELEKILARYPRVKFAEPDSAMSAIPELEGSEATSVWGIDRVDDRAGLDDSYYTGLGLTGEGVHVYVTDTGVFTEHEDFEGRAIPTLDVTIDGSVVECSNATCARDMRGHGTHCAGTVASKTYGIAKKATIHAVKVLADDGRGEFSWLVTALDWIAANGERPAVVSMSLGASGKHESTKEACDQATRKGLTIVVAAGNSNDHACDYVPAYIPSVITVGSTDKTDSRSYFSNFGDCLDIYAPGSSITSTATRQGESKSLSGTSMACPHVAGAAALALQIVPTYTAGEIAHVLSSWSTPNVVKDAKLGSPNKLLYVGDEIQHPDNLPATPAPTKPPVYVDLGKGICKGNSDTELASHQETCEKICTRQACGGYAFINTTYDNSSFTFCRFVPRPPGNEMVKLDWEWGDARCMARKFESDEEPTQTPQPTPSPTSSPTPSSPSPTSSPTPSPSESPPSPTPSLPSPTSSPTPSPSESPPPQGLQSGAFKSHMGDLDIEQGSVSAKIKYTGKNGTKMQMEMPGTFQRT